MQHSKCCVRNVPRVRIPNSPPKREVMLWHCFSFFVWDSNKEGADLSAEENSPVDCFSRRGQGAKRREGARECAEKIPCSPPKVHRNVDRIIVDFFHARKPLERQAHISILSKSDRLRSVQRHRVLNLCGVVLFIANRKMIRKNFDL